MVVYSLIISTVAGIACILTVLIGVGVDVDKVMIGSIMLLIPGINLMNALRDMKIYNYRKCTACTGV